MLAQSEKTVAKITRSLASLKGDVERMTASEVNHSLDKLDKSGSMLTDVFIAEDRGYELPSETFQLSDPLATLYKELHDARTMLRNEISRRYGPGAPSRLPLGKRHR